MKAVIVTLLILGFTSFGLKSQSVYFHSESDVISYLEGRTFFNLEKGLEIQYKYLSSYGTYGIQIKNKYGDTFNYINVNIDVYGRSADLFGMNPNDGGSFGFRLYDGELIVGKGEPGEVTFYLK